MGNILLLHRGALGDFCLTFPFLRELRRRYPEAEILLLGRLDYGSLAAALGLVDRTLSAEASDLVPFLQGGDLPPRIPEPDLFIGWMGESSLSSVSSRPAFGFGPGTRVVIWPPFPPDSDTPVWQHHLNVLHRLETIRGEKPTPAHSPRAPFYLLSREEPRILIHPGSGSPRKNFSLFFFLDLARKLEAAGRGKATFLLGPGEREWRSSIKGYEVLCPASALELARLLQPAIIYIGNDSGPSHLASLLGVLSFVFYKKKRWSSPRLWGTLGERAHHIHTGRETEAYRALEAIRNWQNLFKFQAR